MNFNKLRRQLRHEATSNPKKAVTLGLLLVVALWFWAPLVSGWIGGDEPADEATASKPAATPAAQPPAAPAGGTAGGTAEVGGQTKKEEPPQHPWQKLVEWMDADPRTAATDPLSGRRDPFRPSKIKVGEDAQQDLGLVLSTTIIGPQSRVARINGVSFQQGEEIIVERNGQQTRFILEAVHPRRVVLMRDGKRFHLKIPSALNSGRVKLVKRTD